MIGGISTSETNSVSILFNKLLDLRIIVQFTTLIKIDVFVRIFRQVIFEELMESLDWGSLQYLCIAMIHSSKMVGDQDPHCLAIETYVVFLAKLILDFVPEKEKLINRLWYGCVAF